MEHSWRVREAGPGDLDLIRDLYRVVRGHNRPAAYDRWRYLASPCGPALSTLAVAGSRVVGHYTLWPTPLRIGRAGVAGAEAMDVWTHPDFRGQGIFVALARACLELAQARGIRLLFAFPNGESFPGFVRRLEWTHAGDVRHWIRPIRPSRHPRFSARLPAPLGLAADAVAAMWPTGRQGDYDVAAGPADPARLAMLAEDSDAAGLCRIERASAWIAWRYAAAAAQGYEEITAAKDGTIRAAAVWGMQDESWGETRDGRAHLVELSGADARAREAALAGVISRAHARGAWILETVTNALETIRTLRRAGFVTHRAAPLIVRPLGDAVSLVGPPTGGTAPDPREGRNWRVIGGDLDTF